MTILIALIIEDSLSEAVAQTMFDQTGKPYEISNTLVWNKDTIGKRVRGVNNSSTGFPFFVLTDQDRPEDCPPKQIRQCIPEGLNPNFIYRFAVMETESWVMAHRAAFAKFLSIPVHRIPQFTDEISNPKEFLIQLARKSRKYRLREDLIPAPGATSKVGPDYNGRLCEFVQNHWRAEIAAQNSPSLARALKRLREFKPAHQNASAPSGR